MSSNLNPKRWLILIAVMLAFLPVVIDMTVLHVAVPSLTQSLAASNMTVLWIIDIYPLLMAGLLVPMGTLADRVGNHKILLIGLLVFGCASILAAFAQNAAMLIMARALLAFGGAMIMPCILGIIRKTFEDDQERALALGLWGTVSAAGAAVGPLIGGGLLEYFWWGAVFLINVPIMLVVAPLCYFLLSATEVTQTGKWAFGQAIILITGMISLVYAIKTGLNAQHSLIFSISLVLVAISLLTIFARQQLRSTEPMLDLSLFTYPAILAGMMMAIVAAGVLAGVELTLAMELQYVIGLTPLQAGIFMVPIMIAAAVGGPIAGFLSNIFGLRCVATTSLVISACSLFALAYSDFHHPGIIVPAILALIGLSLSIGLTASSIAIMGSVSAEKGAAAGALEATGYELGTGLGITFFGVFLGHIFSQTIDTPLSLDPSLVQQAQLSIGDSYLVANQLSQHQAEILILAAKTAFSAAHFTLLTTAGIFMTILAMLGYVKELPCLN